MKDKGVRARGLLDSPGAGGRRRALTAAALVLMPRLSGAAPSRTQCRLWDDSYLLLFYYGLAAAAIGGLLLPFIGAMVGRRRWWWVTAPRGRIVVVGVGWVMVIVAAVVVVPLYSGFSWGWPPGMSVDYMRCKDINFGASGLFGGRIGADHPVYVSWPVMIGGLGLCGLIGGGLAMAWTELRRRWLWRSG